MICVEFKIRGENKYSTRSRWQAGRRIPLPGTYARTDGRTGGKYSIGTTTIDGSSAETSDYL